MTSCHPHSFSSPMEQKRWNCQWIQYFIPFTTQYLYRSSTITYDTLVRAGVACTSAAVYSPNEIPDGSKTLTCSRGIKIVADSAFEQVVNVGLWSAIAIPSQPVWKSVYQDGSASDHDLLVIPGGAKGAETISKDSRVKKLVRFYLSQNKHVGMICAGMPSLIPLAL